MSSSDYTAHAHYAAQPAAVYQALTTPDGLRGWWGTDATVGTLPGERIRFRWSATDFTELQIEHLVADQEVLWTCVAQHDQNLPHPDEWLATRVHFVLHRDDANGTELHFTHHGLRPNLACYDICAGGWDWFLRHSLRGLLEGGQGTPFHPTQ